MQVLALGSGFKTLSAEEICLARGVTISAYIQPLPSGVPSVPRGDSGLLVKRIAAFLARHFSPGTVDACARIFLSLRGRFWHKLRGTPGLVGKAGDLDVQPDFPERLQVKRTIPISSVPLEQFDYVLIADPNYEWCRSVLHNLGIADHRILSLIQAPDETRSKLGPVKFLLQRTKRLVAGEPRRAYELLEIRRRVTEDVPPSLGLDQQMGLVETITESQEMALEARRDLPQVYQPGSNWASFIKSTRPDFWNLVKDHRIGELTELVNGCFRNWLTEGIYGGEPTFRTFAQSPPGNAEGYMASFHEVWALTMREQVDISALAMPPIGNPYGFDVDGSLINSYCFMSHYRAALVSRLVRRLTTRPVVAEIGGGVGLFGYYLSNMGDNTLYINFDLPECLFVSSYFLSMAFPTKRILYFSDVNMPLDDKVLESYDIILMPNFMLPRLTSLSVDLFINTISLSEMDYRTIEEYMKQIERCCKGYLYHENLANFEFSYKNYPVDFFPRMKAFEEVITAPSRWPCFSFTSKDHIYIEALFKRRTVA